MNEDRYITEKGFESALAREDIKNKRLWILVIILLVMLFGSNAGWIWYESQFEDVMTVTQETPDGNNNYVGRDGNITNGETNDN